MATMYPQPTQGINTPPVQDFNTPAMAGSLQQFLADNIGQYVVVEFLVGTSELVTKAGVLYAVGTSVMTLYQELTQTFITCDMFSIKFVTFYLPGRRPWQVDLSTMGQIPVPGQWGMTSMPGQGGMPAPGFAPPMDMTSSQMPSDQGMPQGGCSGGNWG